MEEDEEDPSNSSSSMEEDEEDPSNSSSSMAEGLRRGCGSL
jgi:hypothetical protein